MRRDLRMPSSRARTGWPRHGAKCAAPRRGAEGGHAKSRPEFDVEQTMKPREGQRSPSASLSGPGAGCYATVANARSSPRRPARGRRARWGRLAANASDRARYGGADAVWRAACAREPERAMLPCGELTQRNSTTRQRGERHTSTSN